MKKQFTILTPEQASSLTLLYRYLRSKGDTFTDYSKTKQLTSILWNEDNNLFLSCEKTISYLGKETVFNEFQSNYKYEITQRYVTRLIIIGIILLSYLIIKSL